MRHIPNALCVFRMLLVLPVAWLLAHGLYWETLWVFGVAAITDGLDGFLAKRLFLGAVGIEMGGDELDVRDAVLDGKINDLIKGHVAARPGLQPECRARVLGFGRR